MGQKLEEFVKHVYLEDDNGEKIFFDSLDLNMKSRGSNFEIVEVCEGQLIYDGVCTLSIKSPLNSCPYISKLVSMLPNGYKGRICRYSDDYIANYLESSDKNN